MLARRFYDTDVAFRLAFISAGVSARYVGSHAAHHVEPKKTVSMAGWHIYGGQEPEHQLLLSHLRVSATTPVTTSPTLHESITAPGLLLTKPPCDFRIGLQYPLIVSLVPMDRDRVPRELWSRAFFLCQFSPKCIMTCPFVDSWAELLPGAQQAVAAIQSTRVIWDRFHMLASRAALQQRFSRYVDFSILQNTGFSVPCTNLRSEHKSLSRHEAVVDMHRALDHDFAQIARWLQRCLAQIGEKGPWTLIGTGADSNELAAYFPAWETQPTSQIAVFVERRPKSLKVPNRRFTVLDVWGTFRWQLPHVRVLRLSQLPKHEVAS